jgi:hypothetical protein
MTKFTNSVIHYMPSFADSSDFILTAEFGGHVAEVYAKDFAEGNARLLAAAWNAFQSAAEALGTNAVEFAEYCRKGLLAEIVTELRTIAGFLTDLRDYDDDASTKRPHPTPLAERLRSIEALLEAVQPTIKRYTVMLLFPDELRDGAETHLACVEARTPEQAVTLAREIAVEAMFIDDEDKLHVRESFALLGVFAGHVACVLDGQDV